jgi:tetratricopeptide (TPR) repeat protein
MVLRFSAFLVLILFSFNASAAANSLDDCKSQMQAFQFETASACFAKLLEGNELTDEERFQAHTFRIDMVTVVGGDTSVVLNDLNEAIRLKPTQAHWYNVRGGTHADMKNYQAAIDDYAKYISLTPEGDFERAWGYSNSCDVFADWGKLEEALTYCDRALEFGRYPAAFENRGWVHFLRQDYKRAIKDYTTSIEIYTSSNKEDTYASAYLGRALVQEKVGNRKAALADVRKALKLAENLSEGQKKEAQELLNSLLAKPPSVKEQDGTNKKKNPPTSDEVSANRVPRALQTRGRNGKVLVTGTFTRVGEFSWEEINSQNGKKKLRFKALGWNGTELRLRDALRGIDIIFDLKTKTSRARVGKNGKWFKFYDIVDVKF